MKYPRFFSPTEDPRVYRVSGTGLPQDTNVLTKTPSTNYGTPLTYAKQTHTIFATLTFTPALRQCRNDKSLKQNLFRYGPPTHTPTDYNTALKTLLCYGYRRAAAYDRYDRSDRDANENKRAMQVYLCLYRTCSLSTLAGPESAILRISVNRLIIN